MADVLVQYRNHRGRGDLDYQRGDAVQVEEDDHPYGGAEVEEFVVVRLPGTKADRLHLLEEVRATPQPHPSSQYQCCCG